MSKRTTRSTSHNGQIESRSERGRPSCAAVKRPAGSAASAVRGTFPARMPMGQFLFEYLHRRGVRHSFGVPGDFALPTFAWLEKSKIQSITMTHEPGAGFAADAYSRLNGIGLVCVTYCVGGLNVLNAIAGAYAEKSPVVVVSGAPGRKDREKDPLLHHKVKTFETQRRVYDEVTVASSRPARRRAGGGRDRPLRRSVPAAQAAGVHRSAARHGRPGDPRQPAAASPPTPQTDPDTLKAALARDARAARPAKKPVILAGVELHRFGLTDLAVKFAEQLNIPIAADLLSKTAVAENHPLYLGVYGGAMCSDPVVRDYVESLRLRADARHVHHRHEHGHLHRQARPRADDPGDDRIDQGALSPVRGRASSPITCNGAAATASRRDEDAAAASGSSTPIPHAGAQAADAIDELTDPLDMAQVMRIVALHLDEHCCVVTDVGDAIFGAVGIRTAKRGRSSSPRRTTCRWASPSPPASASKWPTASSAPFVLVGDGAFQMTGTELSTAVRLGLEADRADPEQRGLRHDAQDPRRLVQRHQPVELRQNLRPRRRRRSDARRQPTASSTARSAARWGAAPCA